jgi:hypothetical protein
VVQTAVPQEDEDGVTTATLRPVLETLKAKRLN